MRPINLLPPEAAKRSQTRRKAVVYVALAVVFVAALAIVAYWWNTKADDAEERLAQQEDANQELQQQITALEPVKALRDSYEAGAERIHSVLDADVAWGRLLNDLGRVIPDRVWLTDFSGVAETSDEMPGVFGQAALAGTAFDYPDTASWLRVLDSDQWPALGGGWVNSTEATEIGDVVVVDFTSVAALTRSSFSDRAAERVPEVPE